MSLYTWVGQQAKQVIKRARADAIIVGGGPAGYATAIALARQGWQHICVLERSPSVDWHEPTKAISFCLFPHGKDVLRELGMHDIDTAGAQCTFSAHWTVIGWHANARVRFIE